MHARTPLAEHSTTHRQPFAAPLTPLSIKNPEGTANPEELHGENYHEVHLTLPTGRCRDAAPAHVATVSVASGAGPTNRSAAAANEGAKRTTSGSPEVAAVAGGPSTDEVRQDALNALTDETNVLQVPTTQLAKMTIDLRFVELTLDVLECF